MANIRTRTAMRAAGAAVRAPVKVARRLPRARRRNRPSVSIPLPEVHFTSGPRVAVPLPQLAGERPRRTKTKGTLRTLGAAGGTAAAVYLLDPQQGRRRRHMARDRGMKLLRQTRRRAERQARYAAGVQAAKQADSVPSPPKVDLNDPALARKVETEIFRDADAPKGQVDVNVEAGVVYLRGEVADALVIERLVTAARGVEGVHAVESLLRLPGEPVPQKTELLEREPGETGTTPPSPTTTPTVPSSGGPIMEPAAGEPPPAG
jgi:hypothetical protein